MLYSNNFKKDPRTPILKWALRRAPLHTTFSEDLVSLPAQAWQRRWSRQSVEAASCRLVSQTARSNKDCMKSKEPRNKWSVQTMERLFELHTPFHLEFKQNLESSQMPCMMRRPGFSYVSSPDHAMRVAECSDNCLLMLGQSMRGDNGITLLLGRIPAWNIAD